MFVFPAWSGDQAPGEKAIDQLLRLGTPLVSRVDPRTYPNMLGLFDPSTVDGRHYATRTRSVADFTPDLISVLAEAGPAPMSPLSIVSIHHFHGAAERVPLDATAFGIRRKHFTFEIVAAWEPDDADGARHRAWADCFSTALAPHALPGGYPGLLGPTTMTRSHAPTARTPHGSGRPRRVSSRTGSSPPHPCRPGPCPRVHLGTNDSRTGTASVLSRLMLYTSTPLDA
jgi:hypothetical protein